MKKKDVIDYAVSYIYRYPKTEKELIVKLRQKGYTDNEIKKAISFLKSKGWLDDEKFAELYIESELVKKGKPISVVRAKLLSKGVDIKIINGLLTKYYQDISRGILNNIEKEIKKYKSKGLSGFDIIQRLLMKGYKLSDIKKVLR